MRRLIENKSFITIFKILRILSIAIPCIGLLMGIIGAMIQNLSTESGGYSYLGAILVTSGKYLIWFGPEVLIATIVVWIIARLLSKKESYKLPKMGTVFVLTFLAWLAVGVFAPEIHSQGVLACGFKLKQLYTALQQYAKEDPENRYPTPEKWCDLLMEKANLNINAFRCPRDYKGPCSYALNPDANFDSSGDVVLLFETDPGWNQHGKQELLKFVNHKDFTGNTANLVTNNGMPLRLYLYEGEELAEIKWQD